MISNTENLLVILIKIDPDNGHKLENGMKRVIATFPECVNRFNITCLATMTILLCFVEEEQGETPFSTSPYPFRV